MAIRVMGNRRASKPATPVATKTCRCGATYILVCAPCKQAARELRAMADNAADGTTVPVTRPGSNPS